MSDSEEEEEDDEDRLREELKDLIDDNPIEEGSDSDGDNSDNSRHEKRKKRSDDEDELDDRLEDDDYDLLEENLGVKVQRRVSILYLNFIVPKVSKHFGSAKYQWGNYADILNGPHSGRARQEKWGKNYERVSCVRDFFQLSSFALPPCSRLADIQSKNILLVKSKLVPMAEKPSSTRGH